MFGQHQHVHRFRGGITDRLIPTCRFDTLFNVKTPLSILARVRKNGAKELRHAIGGWKAWIPAKRGGVSAVLSRVLLLCKSHMSAAPHNIVCCAVHSARRADCL